MNHKLITIAVVSTLFLAACDAGQPSTSKQEEQVAEQQLGQFLQAQPIPEFNSSQLRQNLIDIQTAQANATATTSFFFNLGVVDPVHVCPSIGFPIPGTYQLTNPEQTAWGHNGASLSWPQLEATGVYTGETSATTVICIDANGRGYAHWWEGFVSTVAGPAQWDNVTKQVVLTGAPSAEFSTGDVQE